MQRKGRLLLLCLLSFAALLLLASGLQNLQFQPGRNLAPRISEDTIAPFQGAAEQLSEVPLWKQVLFGVTLLVLAVVSVWMLPPELRKRLMRQAIRLFLAAGLLMYLVRNGYLQIPRLAISGEGKPASDLTTQTGIGISTFHAPAPAGWLDFLAGFGLLLAILMLARAGLRAWSSHHARTFQPNALDEIASIARTSLDQLGSGRGWEEVIIQAYTRMGLVVDEKRGIKRGPSVTPREFAGRLEYAGLPGDAVKRLTRLFEAVRYGAASSTPAQVQEAVACLNTIVAYCGGPE